MNLCPCGIAAEDSGILCARCAALQILELPPSANPEEIKTAYHLLVKVWHPDRFQGDKKLVVAAEEKLKAINSAYLALSSPPKKKHAKRSGREAPPANSSQNRPPQPPSAGTEPPFVSPRSATASALRSRLVTLAALGIAPRLLVVACGIGAGAVCLKLIDSQMASDPSTAALYVAYRNSMLTELQAPKRRIWDTLELSLGSLKPPQSPPVPAPVAAAGTEIVQAASNPQTTASLRAVKAAGVPVRLMPYITVDMTRDEVLAIAGTPTSSAEDKLEYNSSELYFKDGKMIGWKIDPATSSLRVKLWPDAPVDSSLRFFSIGSTKNDVLAVQGTPTTLAQDRFGYRGSEVYFENNRVVSWKNDPESVPLRAIQR